MSLTSGPIGGHDEIEEDQWIPSCRQLVSHDGGDMGKMIGSMSEERGWDRMLQGPPMRRLL